MIIAKPWGEEEVLELNDRYCLKRLRMKPGCCCSLQYHEKKRETIFVLSGYLIVELEEEGTMKECFVLSGETVTIAPGTRHRMHGHEKWGATYLEASTPELDDVVRIEDKYGRV